MSRLGLEPSPPAPPEVILWDVESLDETDNDQMREMQARTDVNRRELEARTAKRARGPALGGAAPEGAAGGAAGPPAKLYADSCQCADTSAGPRHL